MTIAFDIGGVISKYKEFLNLIHTLCFSTRIKVIVVTDMAKDTALKLLKLNGFEFIPEEDVFSGDYEKYGEACKEVILRENNVDFFFDDFIGYVAAGGAKVNCLVFPNKTLSYYHDDWKTLDQTNFGRQKYIESRS